MNKKHTLLTLMAAFCMSVLFCMTSASAANSTIIPQTITDYTTTPVGAAAQVTVLPGNASATIVPVQIDKAGVLTINYSATGVSGSMDITLFSDAACTMKVGYSSYISSSSLTAKEEYTITQAGTYYLKANHSYSSATGTDLINLSSYIYAGQELTLTSSFQTCYTNSSTTALYHKMVVKSNSLVTITGNSYIGGIASALSAKLCNSNKAEIASIYFYSSESYVETFALKKGTYYIATTTSSPFQLKYSAKAVSDKSGSSKKKAKTLKKKATVKGLVTLQDSSNKVDYYKFTLKKAGKITMNFTTKCNGSQWLKFEIVAKNSKYHLYNNSFTQGTGTRTIKSKKIKKGTYYLKVTKYSADYNGYYAVKYIK